MKDQFSNNRAITKPSSGTRGLGTCLADATHAPKTAPFPHFVRRPLKAGRYGEIPEGKLRTGARSTQRQGCHTFTPRRAGHRFCSMVNLSSSVIFEIMPTGTIVKAKPVPVTSVDCPTESRFRESHYPCLQAYQMSESTPECQCL